MKRKNDPWSGLHDCKLTPRVFICLSFFQNAQPVPLAQNQGLGLGLNKHFAKTAEKV